MWPSHGPVEDDEDYRDRALSSRIARCAANGVVLSGVSRSGKTSLLRRLAEAHPSSFKLGLSLERGGPQAVLARLGEDPSSGVLIDEGQLLLDWPRASIRKLIEALWGRPFVIAAWPSLFDPAAEPDLLRWLEGIRLEYLGPFSRHEAAAMIRRERSRELLQCDDAVIDALVEATGGLPVLLARLCGFLMDGGRGQLGAPDMERLEDFLDAVRSWNDPFQAILSSLPSAHRDALQQLACDARASRACLVEHGLARDNPPRFSGTLLTLAWGKPRATGVTTLAESTPRPRPRPPNDGGASEPLPAKRAAHAFRWLHLSDIHFGAGDASHAFARQAITRAIRDDTARCAARYGAPHRIFVTGDIAQRAHPSEYATAAAWLRELCQAAGAPLSAVRLVPGNHDVDRGVASARSVQRAHEAIRGRPEELDAELSDPALRDALAGKLATYRRFLAETFTDHPPACPTGIDWTEEIPISPGLGARIRVVGLSTVWVSDASDGRDKHAPNARSIVRNLIVGRAQMEHTFGSTSSDDLLLVLSHHPPEWLDPVSESWLSSALAPHAHVHLFGHVHDARASVVRRLGRSGAAVQYVAGATHGDPQETYGYAWGGLRWNEGERGWEVGWAPRVYVADHAHVVADRNRYTTLDAEDFAWQRLDVGWGAPRQGGLLSARRPPGLTSP
ncbi:metallophosphoesterase [Sorangium sp. So ce118]